MTRRVACIAELHYAHSQQFYAPQEPIADGTLAEYAAAADELSAKAAEDSQDSLQIFRRRLIELYVPGGCARFGYKRIETGSIQTEVYCGGNRAGKRTDMEVDKARSAVEHGSGQHSPAAVLRGSCWDVPALLIKSVSPKLSVSKTRRVACTAELHYTHSQQFYAPQEPIADGALAEYAAAADELIAKTTEDSQDSLQIVRRRLIELYEPRGCARFGYTPDS
jgi:hypothetical protein